MKYGRAIFDTTGKLSHLHDEVPADAGMKYASHMKTLRL